MAKFFFTLLDAYLIQVCLGVNMSNFDSPASAYFSAGASHGGYWPLFTGEGTGINFSVT